MSYTQYQAYNNGPDPESGNGGQYNPGATGELGHAMTNYSQNSHYSNAGAPALPSYNSATLTQQDFLARVDFAKSEIRTLTSNIQQIATLHQRALSSADNNPSAALENLVTQTQLKNTQIRDQIKFLEHDAKKTTDGTKATKSKQAERLKSDFNRELTEYRDEEVAYRKRYRETIARQYRIVNPEASDAEVNEASNLDWGSEGVFQTALKTNRTGQASSVLGAVRARHNELQRIEGTLTDLAALFADMAQIVEAQDPVIEHTEQNAVGTSENVIKANEELDRANDSARAARRKKWWCLLIVVIILLIIAAIVAAVVVTQTRK